MTNDCRGFVSSRRAGPVTLLSAVVALAAAPASARGQCQPSWSDQFTAGGLGAPATAFVVFDEDGPGPASASLIAGGVFQGTGPVALGRIAKWDGSRWQPLGTGIQGGTVRALALYDEDGPGPGVAVLIAGGTFTSAGGVPAESVAKWNGREWEPLGFGITGGIGTGDRVQSLKVFDDDGDGPRPPALYAGGNFTHAGQMPAAAIARWDGTSWTPLGAGISGGTQPAVASMEVFDPDGPGPAAPELYGGGMFTTAGSVAATNVARWNGSAWSGLGNGLVGSVNALCRFDQDGSGPEPERLVVGGSFDTAGGIQVKNVACWNGAGWSSLGSPGTGPSPGHVRALAVLHEHAGGSGAPTLYVGGEFQRVGTLTAMAVARWTAADGWAPIGGGDSLRNSVLALTEFDADGPGPQPAELIAGGNASIVLGGGGSALRYDGENWLALRGDVVGEIFTLLPGDLDGPGPLEPRLYAGGSFTQLPGAKARRVAAWNGRSWEALGAGMVGENESVSSFALFDEDGPGAGHAALFAGGGFFNAGGVTALGIARWDGAAWSPVGGGMNPSGRVYALVVFDEDAEGPGPPALFAGGNFTAAGGTDAYHIARWDGLAWTPVGGGTNADVQGLAVFDEDGPGPGRAVLVAAGSFTSAGGHPASRIASWDGSMWNPMGAGLDGTVWGLTVFDPDAEGPAAPHLFAVGSFNGRIRRWIGSPVWAFAGSFSLGDPRALGVVDLDGNGPLPPALFAGGTFTTIGNMPVSRIARWEGVLTWSGLGSGINEEVRAIAEFDDDGPGPATPALYAGGRFTLAGGLPSGGFARWGCPPCYANCDGSTVAPVLNVNDFMCFLGRYGAGDPYSNCDGSTAPPILNVNDFMCFQQRYAAGCP